jgi:hypothetical protein
MCEGCGKPFARMDALNRHCECNPLFLFCFPFFFFFLFPDGLGIPARYRHALYRRHHPGEDCCGAVKRLNASARAQSTLISNLAIIEIIIAVDPGSKGSVGMGAMAMHLHLHPYYA